MCKNTQSQEYLKQVASQEMNAKYLTVIIPKRKKLLIIALLCLVVSAVIITGSILLAKRLNNEQSQNANLITSLPEYESIDSATAFALMKKNSEEWAPDVQYVSCSGTVLPYTTPKGEKIYAGGEDGKMPAWSCAIYSKNLKQDSTIRWSEEVLYLDGATYTWGLSASEIDPDTRNFFIPSEFLNSKDVYDILIASGFDFTSSYITYNFGMDQGSTAYGSQPVWQINEYSRDISDSQGEIIKIDYIDRTGTLLKSVAL